MEKKNVVFLTVLAIATLLTAVVGTTFAYFTATVTGNEGAQTTTVTTAQNLGVTYTDGDLISMPNAIPGDKSTEKVIKVHNDSTATSLGYEIRWTAISNNFNPGEGSTDDLVYSIQKWNGSAYVDYTAYGTAASTAAYDTTAGSMVSGKAYSCAAVSSVGKATTTASTANCFTVYKVPASANQDGSNPILAAGTLAGGAEDQYKVVIYFLETGKNQNANQSTNARAAFCTLNGVTVTTIDESPATQANCTGTGYEWHAATSASTIQFSSKLATNLVDNAHVTAATGNP